MTVGIYRFYNKVTGRSYVGQSKNIEERIKQHFTNIRSKHTYSDTYKKMKEDLEKHGKESFAYEVLEECTVDQLDDREGYYAYLFDVFDSEKGYNTDYWRMKSYESYYRKFNPISEEEKNRMRFKVYTDNYVRSGNPASPVNLRKFFVEILEPPNRGSAVKTRIFPA
ncbi:group I intron endonuclease [Laceyella sacchari]|uniref:GIY-YIG nuclease family protein n=1 Tax=Laceyella sacchari TaxID=37482 RepID=UPI00104F5D84|nr:GIY-YIG nuclease family protein [Laceyella sacchari]TCW41619.1 group I intron endonuclease [Laceyella sacchari]